MSSRGYPGLAGIAVEFRMTGVHRRCFSANNTAYLVPLGRLMRVAFPAVELTQDQANQDNNAKDVLRCLSVEIVC
jgi:hypothetical protein